MKADKLNKYSKLLISPVIIIAIAVILRIVPHPPNFAPIAAMALFGGAYLNRWYAFVVPLLALFLSDLVIGLYSPIVMISVYGSFALSGYIGTKMRKNRNIKKVIFGTVLSSVLFFLVTNFVVWLGSGLYTKTVAGLLESFTLALPFYRNTFLGDLFYAGVFFGGYEFILRFVKSTKFASLPLKS